MEWLNDTISDDDFPYYVSVLTDKCSSNKLKEECISSACSSLNTFSVTQKNNKYTGHSLSAHSLYSLKHIWHNRCSSSSSLITPSVRAELQRM